VTSVVQRARQLEEAFLGGLEDAQTAYEEIVATQAWTELGYDTFAEWWTDRVTPTMRALSMRPTREIAASVVQQVSKEEAELPPAQRRTQRQLAEMAGVSKDTVGRALGTRSLQDASAPEGDLDKPVPGRLCDVPGHGIGPHRACTETMPAADPLPPEIAEQIEQRIAEKAQPPAAWTPAETELRKRVEDGQTVVVSQRGEHARLIDWATERDLFVRVDRRTEWGNPFEMPADGDRATVILAFESHYLPHKPSLLDRLDELRGKALGCWCAPEPCHGDVLATWAEGRSAP
jgi:hypothetical protein